MPAAIGSAAFPGDRERIRLASGNIHAFAANADQLFDLRCQVREALLVWLRDFEDDQLLVSSDLFEVVRAFTNCRPSA